MGIDYGTRRIGISLSDPLQIIAQPFDTLPNDKLALSRICEIVEKEAVDVVVVGMPLNLKGEKAQKAQEVERFIEMLKGQTSAEIVSWDERFTTRMAHQTMLDMGTKRQERRSNKGRIDAMAAAILLQSYLDSRKRSLSC
ncbi:MAG: Holliday junction resolvase RuvX [Ignavibacteriales bacterium]|nr:Holliday junction resolvase RuvX [Ignavibacteriales bacterium]